MSFIGVRLSIKGKILFYWVVIFSERAVWGVGGGGYAARLFLLFSFPCSADHERDWPPCKVVFSGWQPIR